MQGRSSKHKNVPTICFRAVFFQTQTKPEETFSTHLKYTPSLKLYHKIKSTKPKEVRASSEITRNQNMQKVWENSERSSSKIAMLTLSTSHRRRKQLTKRNKLLFQKRSPSMKKLELNRCTIKWLNSIKMLRKCSMIHDIFIILNFMHLRPLGSIHHRSLSFELLFRSMSSLFFAIFSPRCSTIAAIPCQFCQLYQLAIFSLGIFIISFLPASLLLAFMLSNQELGTLKS